MRKKLESKKVIKETDKLAIEPKSLADFKVPEIPLKRIQDIYKSSDLLRSRSESDLLTKNQLDLLKITIPITYDDKHERDSFKRVTRFTNKNTNSMVLKDTTDNHSIQTIFDEYTSEAYDNFQMATSISSASNDPHFEKQNVSSTEKQLDVTIGMEQKNASNDAQTNLSTIRSELQTVSDVRFKDYNANTESTRNKSIRDQSQPKTFIKQFEVQEIGDVDYSSSASPSKSDYPTESAHVSTVTDSNILTYSKKLDFLQLNNKNLSEDISSIENDIKALSEIMSRLSNESNEKSKANKNEINTSQNISEIISKTIFSDKIANITDEEKQTISSEREINMESLSISTNDKKSKSLNESSRDKYISERKSNEISIIISEEVPILSNSTHEIDYEAKSKEIMNQIEKSIISEHITMVDDEYNAISLENENEKLLSDNISELDIKSISEILSKVSESKKSFDFVMNSTTRIVDDSKKSSSEQSEILNKTNLEENFVKDQTDEMHSSKISEYSHIKSMHSPIIAGHRSKESYDTNSQDDLQGTRSISSTKVSHVISENLKSSEYIPEVLEIETSIDDSKISDNFSKDIQTANIVDSTIITSNVDQNRWHTISAEDISQDKNDWTTSDSFEVPQDEISTGERNTKLENMRSYLDRTDILHNILENNMLHIEDTMNREVEINSAGIVDVSAFIPKASINVDVTLNNASAASNVIKSNNELDDILDIIARENQETRISSNEKENIDDVISDSVAELLDKVEDILQDKEGADDYLKEISCDNDTYINDNRIEFISDTSMLNNKTQNEMNLEVMGKSNIISVNTDNELNSENSEKVIDIPSQVVDEKMINNDKFTIDVSLHAGIDNEKDPYETISEIQKIIITELDANSTKDHALSKLQIDTNVELAEKERYALTDVNRGKDYYAAKENKVAPMEIKEYLEPILEQDSSDGEQLDNLVEVAESGLDMVEKLVTTSQDSPESIIDNMISIEEAKKETANDKVKRNNEIAVTDIEMTHDINKTFDLIKDPEYEDISEESLEVSEILDKHDNLRAGVVNKSVNLPDTYRITQKSEEVLKILDEISQKSTSDSMSNSQKNKKDTLSAQSVTEEISELLAEVSAEDAGSSQSNRLMKDKAEEESYEDESRVRTLEKVEVQKQSIEMNDNVGLSKEKSTIPLRSDQHDVENKPSRVIYELHERVSLQEQDGSSESSEAGDTPRGVSEIEMDSPRDFNDSRLDIDVLDDDLLGGTKTIGQSTDVKANFHSTSIVATSEKDIEAMIDKLKGIFTILLLY
jgi:hypothetical protein